MSDSNRPSHPQLLERLASALVEQQFDLKWFVRELVNSKTYQLGHDGDFDEALPRWFQRARVRPLSAEELAESWRVATSYAAADQRTAERLEKGERFFPLTSGYIISFFGKPNNGVGDFEGGLHEHLYLNNGQVGQLISSSKGGLHDTLLQSDEPWENRVERLYVSLLTRQPSDEERASFVEYLTSGDRPEDRLREAIWVLMTCSEYRFNH
jgi:hypothetical protein